MLITEDNYKGWLNMKQREEIIYLMKNTIANMRRSLVLLYELNENSKEIQYKISDKKQILDYITEFDKQGKNFTREQIFKQFSSYKDFKNIYLNLLWDGDILEIKKRVYPLDTKNEIK